MAEGHSGEVFDLVPDDRNSTLIRSVEFEHSRAKDGGAEELFR